MHHDMNASCWYLVPAGTLHYLVPYLVPYLIKLGRKPLQFKTL
jgi:hypothetical protein